MIVLKVIQIIPIFPITKMFPNFTYDQLVGILRASILTILEHQVYVGSLIL